MGGEWGEFLDWKHLRQGEAKAGFEILWKGGRDGLTTHNCKIWNYSRTDPDESGVDGIQRLGVPMRLGELVRAKGLVIGNKVQAGPLQGKASWWIWGRKAGEWGVITGIMAEGEKRIKVHWKGKQHGWSN